jgi:hypothetical protein
LIGAGRTAEVFAWGDDHILKLFQDRMPAVAIKREFALTRLAQQAGLPLPATEERVKVDERLGIIFERIHGRSMLKLLEARPWQLVPIARLFEVEGYLAEKNLILQRIRSWLRKG